MHLPEINRAKAGVESEYTVETHGVPTELPLLSHSLLCVLPGWHSLRQCVFLNPEKEYFRNSISVLITCYFSATFDRFFAIYRNCSWISPRPNKDAWSAAWSCFRHAALKSNGGIVASNAADGWSIAGQKKCFIAVFRFMTLELACEFFEHSQSDAEDTDGSIKAMKVMKDLADDGIEIEYMRMRFERTNE
jgi:hypothetical protein